MDYEWPTGSTADDPDRCCTNTQGIEELHAWLESRYYSRVRYNSDDNDRDVEIVKKLFQDLDQMKLRGSNGMKSCCEELLTYLPPLEDHPSSAAMKEGFENFFARHQGNFSTQTEQWQLALSDIIRLVILNALPEDNLSNMARLIMEASYSSSTRIRCRADLICSELCDQLRSSKLDFSRQYSNVIAQVLAGKLMRFPDPSYRTSVVLICCQLLDIQYGTHGFVRHMDVIPALLTVLVHDGTEPATEVIEFIAELSEIPIPRLIEFWFQYLVPLLVVQSESMDDLERTMQFIESIVGTKLTEIEIVIRNHISNGIIVFLDSKPEAALRGIRLLAMLEGSALDPEDSADLGDYAKFLVKKFFAFVYFVDDSVSPDASKVAPVDHQIQILSSFAKLIQFLGEDHIPAFRIKLLSTLERITESASRAILPACFKCWDAFLRNLDMASVKSILSHVSVILMPHAARYAEYVAPIFEYLIIECRHALVKHFPELFFIPELPQLREINEVLRQYRTNEQLIGVHFIKYLKEAIQFVDVTDSNNNTIARPISLTVPVEERKLRYPQPAVKQLALVKLRNLVRDHQDLFYNRITGSKQSKLSRVSAAEVTILNLISVLLKGCSEAHSTEEKKHFAEVLGAVGAVDPDRVEFCMVAQENTLVFRDINSPEFAKNFLKELVKGYMVSKGAVTDIYSFVIQETLRFYRVKTLDEDRLAENAIWRELGSDYHDVLRPFFTSAYRPELPYCALEPYPIFNYKRSESYIEWLKCWTTTMITQIKNTVAYTKFLEYCQLLLQWDPLRSITLLPYVFLLVLLHGTENDVENLKTEMMTIFHSHRNPQAYSMDLRYVGTQTMLTLLDFLKTWSNIADARQVDPDDRVSKFREYAQDDLIAEASLNCEDLARALMHYELFIRLGDADFSRWNLDNQKICFLQKVFVGLEEADGIAGLNAVRKSPPSLQDQIVLHRSSGNIQEAQICYEQIIQQKSDPDNCKENHCKILRCYLDLEQANTAMSYCNGQLLEHPDWVDELNNYRVEAAWKLSQWDTLAEHLSWERKDVLPSDWNVGIGRLLLAAREKESEEFRGTIAHLRSIIVAPICAVTNTEKMPFHHAYDHIVLLHTLQEIEEGAATWFEIKPYEEKDYVVKSPKTLLAEWKLRLQVAQSSYPTLQKILNIRRTIFQASENAELREEIGRCWLQSARVARKSNQLQTAYTFLLNAEPYNFLEFPVEQAKRFHLKGESEKAIEILESASKDDRWRDGLNTILFAKMKLLLTRYLEETEKIRADDLVERYKEVVKLAGGIEKSHLYLGQFYDKVLEAMPNKNLAGEQIYLVIEQFVESLKHGCRFIYQSLPRLLALWLDYGTNMTISNKEHFSVLMKIHNVIRDAVNTNTIPKYIFLTALSQLISRIGNENEFVFDLLSKLIVEITKAFPRQAMWQLSCMKLSRNKVRQERYKKIIDLCKQSQPKFTKFFTGMEEFCQLLVTACRLMPDDVSKTTGSFSKLAIRGSPPLLTQLQTVLSKMKEYPPVLPFWAFMNPALPTVGCLEEHSPFGSSLAEISEFEDQFTILTSIQRPKRVSVIDSTGKRHFVMLKNQDDLRKDARFMELIQIINQFLQEDSECRRRQLHMRAYSVVPLDEDSGIIEWVPNVDTLRGIIIETYNKCKLPEVKEGLPPKTLTSKHQGMKEASTEAKLAVYRSMCLIMKPVFHSWFYTRFPDPTEWLKARMTYTRTMAVLSIVGYIMGLGDRHGENILIDQTTAEAFNIDFGCLFNKGSSLPWPETVPFRLTRNVVHGMGPLGVEGMFRKGCEMTLQVMRHNKNATMNVLKTFLHDPLVEWRSKEERNTRTGSSKSNTGLTPTEAIKCLHRVEQRISGQETTGADTLPLSVSGHVDHLINEATSDHNLCKLWIGWGAYH